MLKNKVIVCVFAVFALIVQGKSDGTDEVSVSVMEGDSVTLYTTRKQEDINWYVNVTRVAYIHGNQSKICPDDQCDEKFRDRLKLDHHTGSLTITNTTNTDSGEYKPKISSSGNIFSVSVSGVSAAEGDQVKRKSVKEGESVTLQTPVGKNPFDEMTLYFKDIPITKMTGDQSKICTDDQCNERFRNRLKLDHQTGSLTITNTRTTDDGEYKVEITISNSFSIIRSFSVTVTDPGLSPAAVAGISFGAVLGALLVGAAVGGGIYYSRNKRSSDDKENMHGVPYEVLENDG